MGNLHDPPLASGGPTVQLHRRIQRMRPEWSATSSAFAFAWLTWAPILLFVALKREAVAQSFLRDTSIHLRLLVAGPIAILAEPVVNRALSQVTQQFITSELVGSRERDRFARILHAAKRLREHWLPETLALAIVYGVNVWQMRAATLSWYVPSSWAAMSLWAWHWYAWVGRPLGQFLAVRWIWRIAVWALLLWRTSRLELSLSASHPDRSGGLGFLAVAYANFSLVAFVFSVMWTAGWHDLISHGDSSMGSLQMSIPLFVALQGLVFLGPFVVFTPSLIRLRRQSLFRYDRLGMAYCRMFEGRLITVSPSESDLATADFRDFADMQSTIRSVREMKPFPIDPASLIVLALGAILPMIPLLTLIVPIDELIKRTLGPIW